MKDQNKFIVTGVSGSGKNWVLDSLKQSGFDNFKEVHAGSFISREFLNNSNLTSEENIDLAFQKIKRGTFGEIGWTAINCHAIYGKIGKLYSNEERISKLNAGKIVTIETDPEMIIQQRKFDIERTRNNETIEELIFLQNKSIDISKKIAKSGESDFLIFKNHIDKIEDLIDFLKD